MSITIQIKEIIDNLYQATKTGDIKWIEDNGNKYERNMKATSEDSKTEFEIDIKYKLKKNKWELQTSGLFIRNELLPNNSYYAYGGEYKINNLRDIVKKMYCLDLNPKEEDVVIVLSDIKNNISKSIFRDNKLKSILNKLKP